MSFDHSLTQGACKPVSQPKAKGGDSPLPSIDRIVGESECGAITNLSRTSRWRLMQHDDFPQKIRISPNRTGWKLSSILAWLAKREAV